MVYRIPFDSELGRNILKKHFLSACTTANRNLLAHRPRWLIADKGRAKWG